MKLRRVDIGEAVGRFLDRTGLAEVTRKALTVLRLFLSGIRHVRCNVHQSGNRRIRSRFRNYGSPITMTDQNARSILLSEDALRGSHILIKGRLGLLHDAD